MRNYIQTFSIYFELNSEKNPHVTVIVGEIHTKYYYRLTQMVTFKTKMNSSNIP